MANWRNDDEWTHRPSSKLLLKGARAQALQYGYTLEVFSVNAMGVTPKRISSILYNRGIRGIIISPLPVSLRGLALDWDKFSVVTVEHPFGLPTFHHVSPDYYMDMNRIWSELSSRGYRKVGLVLVREQADRVRHRWDAAHIYNQARAGHEDPPPIIYLDDHEDFDGFRAWLVKYRPDAIMGKADNIVRWLGRLNYSIPRDIGYVGLNVCDQFVPVSGIEQRREAMGEQIVESLNALLLRGVTGSMQYQAGTIIQSDWRDGPSLCTAEQSGLR